MRQLILECLIDLPDDVHTLGDTVLLTKEPWLTMQQVLTERQIVFQARAIILETRAKTPVASPKRTRRAKVRTASEPAQSELMPDAARGPAANSETVDAEGVQGFLDKK
jgi:hypothetical protein